MKTDANVPSKRNKQKKFEKNSVFVGILKATDEVCGTDPRIRIHTKMSRIHNTDQMYLCVTNLEKLLVVRQNNITEEETHLVKPLSAKSIFLNIQCNRVKL
jgi:hypothetical protein